MNVCPSCARESPADFAFCPGCGAKLGAEPRPFTDERKVVTTLCCDLVSYTAHSEAADHELIDELLRRYNALARRLVEGHGGGVEKFIGDAVLAVFGFPTAHDDDAERAVRCALKLGAAAGELAWPDGDPVQVRVGVNSGETYVHLGVDPASGETFLTGDAVNTAARLQTAAPVGAVVVGELTKRLSAAAIAYEELPPVTVKGKREPLALWRAVEPRSRTGLRTAGVTTSPFLGRAAELRRLRQAFEAASAANQAQFVLLIGEPGIGKSRLVLELARALDERPELVTWRQGRCLPYGEGVSFSALAEILKAHAGILDSDDVPTVESKLEAILPEGEDRSWLRQRLRPLLGLEAAQASREESFAAWTLFLQHVASADPTVLVLEDLHWAGEGMLAFVQHLASERLDVPLLIVGTARPELLTKRPDALKPADGVGRVVLSPLRRKDAARLVSSLLDERLAATVRGPVLERVGGNPLYAEEYVRLLLDRGLLLKTEGVLQLREGEELPLPDTVQAVLAARLDTLPPDHKALLSNAAVFGQSFWDGGVAALAGRDPADVRSGMAFLAERQLVRAVRSSSLAGETEYLFSHALARDVAYAQLPRKSRAQKHAAAAGWLEAKLGDRVEDLAEVVAHHYATSLDLALGTMVDDLAGCVRPAAIRTLHLAGDRVRGLDRHAAERHYSRALGYVAEGDIEPASLLGARGGLLKQLGRYDEAANDLQRAADILRKQGSIPQLASIKSELAGARERQGDTRHLELVDEAVALLEGQPPSAEMATVLDSAARYFYGSGRASAVEALSLSSRAVEAARAVQSPDLCSILAMRGLLRGDLSDVEASDTDMTEALELAHDHGLGLGAFILEDRLYQLSVTKGPAQAYEVACQANELFRSYGDLENQYFCRSQGVELLMEMGSWDRCLREADELGSLLEQRGHSHAPLISTRGVQLLVFALRGEREKAAPYLDWLEHSEARRDLYAFSLVLIPAATAHILAGEFDEGRTLLREWDERCDEAPGDMSYLWLQPQVARSAVLLDETDVFARVHRRDELASPLRRHAQLTVHAIALEARGEFEAAAAGFVDAAARWHGFGVPYEEGHALLGQGRCLVALGRAPEAAASLAAAREIFARLGARPALAEVNELLAAVSD